MNVGKLEASVGSAVGDEAVGPVAVTFGSSEPQAANRSETEATTTNVRIKEGYGRPSCGGFRRGWRPVAPSRPVCHDRSVGAEHRVARSILEDACRTFVDNVRGLTLEEALDAAGGFRSILGLMKHTAAWCEVYRSFAFDPVPKHWEDAEWPRGLRERIEPADEYLAEILEWFERGAERWNASVAESVDLDEPRPVHWGDTLPLRDIIAIVAGHWYYHAGEINAILAVRRGEAWEYGEAVEENHISSVGHSVRRPWISDEDAERFERRLRELAAERDEYN